MGHARQWIHVGLRENRPRDHRRNSRGGFIPVIACGDENGITPNINADHLAGSLARLKADMLVALTDAEDM